MKIFVELDDEEGTSICDYDCESAPGVGEHFTYSDNDINLPRAVRKTYEVIGRSWTWVRYSNFQGRMECMLLVTPILESDTDLDSDTDIE